MICLSHHYNHKHLPWGVEQVGWLGQTGSVYDLDDPPYDGREPGSFTPLYIARNEECGHSQRRAHIRTFYLQRDSDISGVSGTGHVADGAVFEDGTTVIHWLGEHPSTVMWPDISHARAVHGHKGATQFVFDQEQG